MNACMEYGGKFPLFLLCRRRMMDVAVRPLRIQGLNRQPVYVEGLGFRLTWI
jgi:hypothetical protein